MAVKISGVEVIDNSRNITTNIGTVDGRDIAADGAKLDGIEANAKDDQTITAGSGLTGGGTGDVTLSHADTSSQASVNNSGRTFIQDITLDTYGHVTGIVSATDADTYVGTVTSVNLTAGTGMSVSGGPITSNGSITVTNTAPDQTVVLTEGANVTITGTYPNFTIASTDTNTTYTAGTGLDLTGTAFSIDGTVATLTGSQTLTNKTLTSPAITAPTITGTVIEDVYALSGTAPALEPANGSIQTWTLAGNSTPTDSLAAGEAITLMINDGSSRTVSWPTMTWVNNGGSAPTLATSGYTVVALWKVGSTLYGALVGDGS